MPYRFNLHILRIEKNLRETRDLIKQMLDFYETDYNELKEKLFQFSGEDDPATQKATRGSLWLNFSNKRAEWKGVPLSFTSGEFGVVDYLSKYPDIARPYSSIFNYIHPYGYKEVGERQAIASHVKRIRAKLLDIDSTFNQLETIRGIGYLWKETP